MLPAGLAQNSSGLSPSTGYFCAWIGACAESKKPIDRAEAAIGPRQTSKAAVLDKSFMVARIRSTVLLVFDEYRAYSLVEFL